MADRSIPEHPEAVTAGWLTNALRSSGVIGEAAVTSIEHEGLGEGAGFVGQLARYRLQYDRLEEDAPQTLIAKFPSPLDTNRAAGEMFGLYDHEIRFYRELAQHLPVQMPRHYYSDMDPSPRGAGVVRAALGLLPAGLSLRLAERLTGGGGGRRYILLLEDLAHARVGDQVAGLSAGEAELALRQLAAMHASMWNSPLLESASDWVRPLDADAGIAQALYRRSWPGFLERYGERLPPAQIEIGEWAVTHGTEVLRALAGPPRTLLHGDYRADNLFFGDDADGPSLYIIDWQGVGSGRGVTDVAYFIGYSLAAEQLGEERELVNAYHAALLEHGVDGYDFDRCWRDYRLSRLFVMHRGVMIVGMLDLSHERGVALIDAALDRMSLSAPADIDLATILD